MAHLDEHMKDKWINFDLSHIRKEDVDDLILNLDELQVGVKSRNGDNVWVYCE